MADDPYASIAKPVASDPYASMAGNSAPTPPPAQPTVGQTFLQGAKDFGTGLLKGAASTASNLQHIPYIGAALTAPPSITGESRPAAQKELSNFSQTQGTMQGLGKGAEQAAEFLIPGGAEEGIAAKAAEFAPKAAPLFRVGAQALSSGLMNKAQGGNFGSGAAMGGAAGALGEGLRAAAPTLAEKAIGIRGKFDRSFNKAPGRALLDETKGINPENIANQAKSRISANTQQVNSLADAASTKPNPVRGLLPSPAEEIPLATTPGHAPANTPMAFDAQANPHFDTDPEMGGSMPHYLSGGEHPELSGRQPVTQGVLLRRGEGSAAPLPSLVPNRTASLAPARNAITGSMGTAARENAEGTFNQLQGMGKTLHQNFLTHEAIPEQVTPRELVDLRRGFNQEHGQWNPDLHEPAVAAGRQAYGAMTNEFHRLLPEAEPIERSTTNLIPVANRAKLTALNDNIGAKVLGRVGAHTGALGGALTGGYVGYQHGGAKDAVLGGLAGAVVPELIASPQGQLAAARLFNHPTTLTRPVGGALLNIGRNYKSEDEQQDNAE